MGRAVSLIQHSVFGLVELEPYAVECGDGGLEGGGDAVVVHEECDVVHVRRSEYSDIVPGQCGGYFGAGARAALGRRRLPLKGSPWELLGWW